MHLSEIMTPALLLDKNRFMGNIEKMSDRIREFGVELRPHLKTCKSVAAAQLALGSSWSSASVSTLAELDGFFAAGITDLRYTAPFAAQKLEYAAPLIRRGLTFSVLLDDPDNAENLGRYADILQVPVEVIIEIDTDNYRAGVPPNDERFEQLLNTILEHRMLNFAGLYSFAGKTYKLHELGARETLVENHRVVLVETATRLEARGLSCTTIGIGGSPAVTDAVSLDGLTEACVGVYMFQDLAQCGIGVARRADIAVTVLATVVQHKPDSGRLFIDAGALALSQDRSTAQQTTDFGYGLVCRAEDATPLADGRIIVSQVSQEHGLVTYRDGSAVAPDVLPVGAKVRVMPNHVCMMAAAFPGYYVLDAKGHVEESWPRINGWFPSVS